MCGQAIHSESTATPEPARATSIAAQRGLVSERAAGASARLHEWLCFIGTELHKALVVPLLDETAEAVTYYALQKYRSRLDHVERHLPGRECLLDQLSVADAYLFVGLNWSGATPIALTSYPALRAYYERLRKRPSFARALSEELVLFRNERARHGKPLPAAVAG